MGKHAVIWKRVLVVEIIVCYLAALTVLSYARGPARFRPRLDEPLLRIEDFVSFSGQPAAETGMRIENGQAGTSAGYEAQIQLKDLDGIWISFTADCPEQYAGGVLYVDLYNGEEEYDSPEQEFSMQMQPGTSQVAFSLEPGAEHPDTARLRIFTLDMAGYALDQLLVCRQERLPQVPAGPWIGLVVCAAVLCGTAVWIRIGSKRSK